MLGPGPAKNDDVFSELKPFLADRQIVFGNLEGPLTDRGTPTKDPSAGAYFLFRSPPARGRLLKEAGFNILSLANNHINDYGPDGRAQTVSVLKRLGIRYTGGPGEVARLKAGKTTLSFIGLAPNIGSQDLHDLAGAVALVKAEAARGNLVVVSFHGGGEGAAFMRRVRPRAEYYLGENRGNLPVLAHALIDAGADLVLGHGPHVPRGLRLYKGRLIAWSLGNFATLSGMSIRGPAGLAPLLLVDLAPDGALRRVRVVSFKQEEPRRGPRLDPENRAARIMAWLSRGDLPAEWLSTLWKQ
jgi:poly-gamma-glutamate capsule biosynthesis protein CapA/YwtB (metallophosphatase superfamily)